MKPSLSYRLTQFIIKLKGLKKNFSKDPIDYKRIRKEDMKVPKGSFFEQNIRHSFDLHKTWITEIATTETPKQLLLFVHGGAFVSGPAQIHWDAAKQIAKQTQYTIWMCDYPKAPEHDISEISENMDAIFDKALERFQPNKITLLGDSVGGTLITALVQRLVSANQELPKQIVLISPVMDSSMSNPDITQLEEKDIILSTKGVLSAKKMCAKNVDLKDPMISPIYGSFDSFPRTILFFGENDIMYPDEKLTAQKLADSKVDTTIVLGEQMPHIWPLLPVMKEAKIALQQIVDFLHTNR